MNNMYGIPTDGCNLEIMGYPFFAENVSVNEAFRRRELNFNNIVGGTSNVTKGAYVGLDFQVTTHVKVDPNRPDMWNHIFREMMNKSVRVQSPELGGTFNANVVIKPEHETPSYLKLTIDIKEIPDAQSKIPGESFKVPSPKKIKVTKKKTNSKTSTKTSKKSKSKKKSVSKKSKSKKNK